MSLVRVTPGIPASINVSDLKSSANRTAQLKATQAPKSWATTCNGAPIFATNSRKIRPTFSVVAGADRRPESPKLGRSAVMTSYLWAISGTIFFHEARVWGKPEINRTGCPSPERSKAIFRASLTGSNMLSSFVYVRTTIFPPALFCSMQRCASTISSRRKVRPIWTCNFPAATC